LLAKFSGIPGLYFWNYTVWPGVWYQISPAEVSSVGFVEPFDPDHDGEQEVASDFDSLGLWLYDDMAATWTPLTSADPVYMVRCDLDGTGYKDNLICNFGTLGLWVYCGPCPGWTCLTAAQPD
jgi:hypothetical protein